MSDPIKIVVDKTPLTENPTSDKPTPASVDEIKAHGQSLLQELIKEGKPIRKTVRSDSNISSVSGFDDFTDALSSVRVNSSASILFSSENLTETFGNTSISGDGTSNGIENSIDEIMSGTKAEENPDSISPIQGVNYEDDIKGNHGTDTNGNNSSDRESNTDADADDDSTDSDFGSFSDASYENDATFIPDEELKEEGAKPMAGETVLPLSENNNSNNDEHSVTSRCLRELFGDLTTISDPEQQYSSTYQLEDLLREERPRVVYHKLVDKVFDIPPFIWSKSYVRSTVLNILRIPDPLASKKDNNDITPATLNDSLFTNILKLISDDDDIAIRPNGLILKEHFNIKYIPTLSQHTLRDEDTAKSGTNIPKLLDPANLESRADNIQDYHDELCNSIDQLIRQLKSLKERAKQLNDDKTTLEHVVTNLSGHTQRLQRDQIALYNKKRKQQARWKRFSWINR